MLYFWRREFELGDVRTAGPKQLFVEGELYTGIKSDGTKDLSIEEAFSRLESDTSEFLRQLLPIVREGRTPNLDPAAWSFFFRFMYFSMKRSPAYIAKIAQDSGHLEILERTREELRRDGELSEEDRAKLDDPNIIRAENRNLVLAVQAGRPSDLVVENFKSNGMALYVAPPGKSFILGDRPDATARLPAGNVPTPHGLLHFLPVSPDIAIGFSQPSKSVLLFALTPEEIRAMNVAMASQSKTIAGASPELVASLSRTVSYVGVRSSKDLMAGRD